MKIQVLTLALALVSGSALAANKSFLCKEIYDLENEVSLTRHSVKVTELANITGSVPYGHEYDAVLKVKVDLTKTLGRKITTSSFEAIAKTEDVMYFVSAKKAQGFSLNMYLDEMDATTMTLTDAANQETSISMSCDVL